MENHIAFSVDLEPNKDGSFVGVAEAMDWLNALIPQSTIYTTYRVATEQPDIVASLADSNELGVHVHPKEFGHNHDSLATLQPERQRELIIETRQAVADAAGFEPSELTAFRAGRHQASEVTLEILRELDFKLDASAHVRYRNHLPASLTDRQGAFELETGLVELPTTYGYPPLFSRTRLWTFPRGVVTATAHTLRADRIGCSGHRAVSWLCSSTESVVSMYMHPYDATDYEDIENSGDQFRSRLVTLIEEYPWEFVTANDICCSVS